MLDTRNMLFLLLSFVYLHGVNGFLLEPQSASNQTANNKLFLTMTEFLDNKKQMQSAMEELHHETAQLRLEMYQLRHDMDNTLNTLTFQIQDKLDIFEQKITKFQHSNDSKIIQLQFQDLLNNHSKLQPLQDFQAFKYNFTNQEQELMLIKNMINEVLQNNTKIQGDFETLLNNFRNQQQYQLKLMNTTNELVREVQDLKLLKNVQVLQDFNKLQQEVQLISSQTHAIRVNEQARIQDFLALYNVTLFSKQMVSELEVKTDTRMNELTTSQNQTTFHIYDYIQNLVKKQNSSFENKLDELSQNILTVGKTSNYTLASMKQQIIRNGQKVAMTSCIDRNYGSKPAAYIVMFDSIRTQVGIHNLTSFVSEGKFTCETDGLYMVAATLMSSTPSSTYVVYKNGIIVARSFITSQNAYHSSTAVVAVELHPNDTVWIQTVNAMDVFTNYGYESCLTIVMI